MEKHLLTLSLPYANSATEMVFSNCNLIASLIGFSERESLQLQIAMEEIITNALKNNLNKVNPNEITVSFSALENGIKIEVRETGIPFDPENFPVYEKDNLLKQENPTGLGIYLIKEMVDNVDYKMSRAGKEIILIKYKKDNAISASDVSLASESVPQSPVTIENFIVREIDPKEAVEVTKEAYLSYGYGYLVDEVYNPSLLRKLNVSRDFISIVSVSDAGEILGHVAVIKHKFLKGVFEFGAAFVNPKYRGGGLLKSMTKKAFEIAESEGGELAFVDCVTTHAYSQKVASGFGFVDSCIFLARLSQSTFHEIKAGKGRETLISAFYSLKKIPPCTIFLPVRYDSITRKILNNLNLDVQISSLEQSVAVFPEGETAFHYYAEKFNTGHLYVDLPSADFSKALFKQFKKICISRVDVIYLYLPLGSPFIDMMTEAAVQRDFFFAGIVPDNTKGHYLVLQYLNNYLVDYDAIDIFSEPGKALKEFIKYDDPNKKLFNEEIP
ncbi:MAG: GNAT family N-acetyltransferase [Ignavibacteriales bacterium]|jgi:serine/threonine-protein kinase RsbW|nr:GNAT family N-acetyltransferase [Ignavibacteriaceae bacterium]NLH62316.1 GNAT family N-acetyltransferase [Ignavibacteriales bacterium]HPO55471.1 GNAT family N-acetyltransferase [Ignavibacteriaceae bacterium]